MKFSVSSSTLSAPLQALSKVINSKNTLSILDSFLFEIENNRAKITASDQETTIVSTVDLISSDGDFSFCMNAKNIQEALKEIPDQPVEISLNGNTNELKIAYQSGEFNFVAASSGEYPHMKPVGDRLGSLTLTASALLKGISSTIFASADDEIRPVMNGVVLDITSDSVTFVASDSHKLARLVNTRFHGEGMEEGAHSTLIIRKKPMNILKGLLGGKGDGEVNIVFGRNQMMLQYGGLFMSSLLIEGRFPNYNAVIPQNNPFTVCVDRLTLVNAVKRVSICSDPANSLIKLRIADNTLALSSQNIDFSTSAEESLPCQYEGEEILIGFKSDFLLDILQNLATSEVIFRLADSARAGLVLPSENAEDEDLVMLLMPMMIKA